MTDAIKRVQAASRKAKRQRDNWKRRALMPMRLPKLDGAPTKPGWYWMVPSNPVYDSRPRKIDVDDIVHGWPATPGLTWFGPIPDPTKPEPKPKCRRCGHDAYWTEYRECGNCMHQERKGR